MAVPLILSPTGKQWWLVCFDNRVERLKKLQNADAPEVIIAYERELIDQAWNNILIWDLFEISDWEIDINTGKMTILKTTPEGRLMIAMLECEDDSPTQE